MIKNFNQLTLRIGALSLMLLALTATSCTSDKDQPTPEFNIEGLSVFVINSGGSGNASASLDVYAPASKTTTREAFRQANNIPLGDIAQSSTLYNNDLYIVVGNSNVIHKLNPETMKRTGTLNIESPRYIYFVSADKAYVSHLGSGDITVFNPKTMTITKKITTYQSAMLNADKNHLSTEEWQKVDDSYVLVSCWSYHNKVLLIDTKQDKVVKEIEVGAQPKSMGMDKNGKVWVLCEGRSWEEINPTIWTIDTKANYTAAKIGGDIQKLPELKFPATSSLRMNQNGDAFYFYNAPHIFKMDITEKAIPTTPFIKMPDNCNTYSLNIAPNGDLYIGDAKDYQQDGTVYRYSAEGKQLDSFTVGLLPIDFVFYVKK